MRRAIIVLGVVVLLLGASVPVSAENRGFGFITIELEPPVVEGGRIIQGWLTTQNAARAAGGVQSWSLSVQYEVTPHDPGQASQAFDFVEPVGIPVPRADLVHVGAYTFRLEVSGVSDAHGAIDIVLTVHLVTPGGATVDTAVAAGTFDLGPPSPDPG